MTIKIFRASIGHFPVATGSPDTDFEFIADGGLVTRNDKIEKIGGFTQILEDFPQAEVIDYQGKLLLPGFIDTHVHFPQTEMIAHHSLLPIVVCLYFYTLIGV